MTRRHECLTCRRRRRRRPAIGTAQDYADRWRRCERDSEPSSGSGLGYRLPGRNVVTMTMSSRERVLFARNSPGPADIIARVAEITEVDTSRRHVRVQGVRAT